MNEKEKQQNKIETWLKQYAESLPELKNGCHFPIKRVHNIIQSRFYNNEFTVKKLKRQCRLKRNNFSTRFKHFAGKTPKQ